MASETKKLLNYRKAVDVGLREARAMGINRFEQANLFSWEIRRRNLKSMRDPISHRRVPQWHRLLKRWENRDVIYRLSLIRELYSELDFSAKTPKAKRHALAKPQPELGGHTLLQFIQAKHMSDLESVVSFVKEEGVE